MGHEDQGPQPSGTQAVIDLARQSAAVQGVDPTKDYLIVDNDGRAVPVDLSALNSQPPARAFGTYKPSDVESFINYVTVHEDEAATTVWIHPTEGRVVAVLDDHSEGGTHWGRHRAELILEHSPEWLLWVAKDGKMMDQVAFAEHLREGMPDILEPNAATLIEIAESFETTTGVHFRSKVDFNSGAKKFKYDEETKATATSADGEIAVPRKFKLTLSPFLGEEPVEIIASLRHNSRSGNLELGYKLERPERAIDAALDRVAARLDDRFKRVYRGTPA
jgi:uncharacterized protein YfdQ (DUF2303 family)